MKLTYFFPIFRDDDGGDFFSTFLQTEFFSKHETQKIVVVVNQDDEKNLEKMQKIAKKHAFFMIFVSKKSFSYNSALKNALPYLDGDVVLLGDLKTNNIQIVFEKCLEKHQNGAKIVNVKKVDKSIFARLWQKIYGFFTKLFTNKKDGGGILSLGLVDKDVVQLMRALPNKAIFIKNADYNYNLPTATLFVDKKVNTYKENFFKKTFALKTFFFSSAIFILNLFLLIILNIISKDMMIFNYLSILVEFLLLIVMCVSLPKQIFNCRNIVFEDEEVELVLQKVNKDVRATKKNAK